MWATLAQALLLVIIFVIARTVYHRIRFRSFYKVPVPPGSLLLGHIADIAAPNVHRRLTSLANRYGGMYRIKALDKHAVVLTDPSSVKRVVAKSELNLPKATVYQNLNLFYTRQPQPPANMFTFKYDDPVYKAIRQPVALAFSTDNIRDNIFQVALTCSAKLRTQIDKIRLTNTQNTVNVDGLLLRSMFDFSMMSVCGIDYKTLDGDNLKIIHAFKRTTREMQLRPLQPWRLSLFKLFPFLPGAMETLSSLEITYSVFDQAAAAIKARGEPSPGDKSLWACLARMKDAHTKQPLDMVGLTVNTAVVVIGAADTTSHQAGWLLYDIACHPEVQRRICRELAEAGFLVTEGATEAARKVTYNDLVKLPYLNCVIMESMRMHTVAATGPMRQTDGIVKINGTELPSGTLVMLPFYPICRSRHNFPNPDEFIPERWAPTLNGASVAPCGETKLNGAVPAEDPRSKGVANVSSFFPFSMGPRDCLGRNVALMILRLLAVELCGNYWWEVAAEMGSKEEVMEKETMALVLTYPGGIKLNCRRHNNNDHN